ncbi:dipeptidase gliJ [Aspergillus stella-maris]|uniref:dipeptidase gliJ n=1 Tax=Aspergillus stella-maris TaxID=1810926 RepID=UPI003CCCE5A3
MSQALRILKEVPLIDGHNDFPYMIRGWLRNNIDNHRDVLYDMPIGHTDIKRIQQGCLGGQFWSAYVPCPKPGKQADELQQTLQQIDVIHRLIETFPDVLRFAASADEIWSCFRTGRVASLIGVEGLHQIGDSPAALRMLYRLGVRYVTLTHNCHNWWADAANISPPLHGGLSKDGEKMVREMNRIGMIIDLSHTSHETQSQVLQLSEAPVIYSHSSIYTLTPHARNTTDSNLNLLASKNGLIMISFLRGLTTPDSADATLPAVLDHILYAGERIGYDHVGIGSDFDGMLTGPEGLSDVSCYPALVAGLLERGVDEGDVKKVLGFNVIRVLREVEEVKGRLEKAGRGEDRRGMEVLSDEIEEVWDEELKGILVAERERRRVI